MGVLKAKVGGSWVEIPGVGVAGTGVVVERAAYTPVLVSITPGTTGTNQADYLWIGGPNVGDPGELTVQGRIQFNGTGMVYPTTPSRIALPVGFNMASNYTTWELGQCRHNMAGAGYKGVLATDTADPHLMQIMVAVTTSTTVVAGVAETPATATLPAWAAAAEVRWKATLMAVRV